MPLLLVLTLLMIGPFAVGQEKVTLEDFLGQVREQHLGIKAAHEASRGAQERQDEADLLFRPQAFAEAQFLDDQQEKPAPASQGTRTQGSQYRLGLMNQNRYGLKARLFTELDYASLSGTSPLAVPLPKFHDGKQTLELSQSLWKNGFGSEVRAMEEALKRQAEAKSLAESFKAKATLTAAEMAYWRLSAARQAVHVKEASLARAEKIRAWNVRREQLDLGRKSDLLQADAAVKLVELDLQAARDEERVAAWNFNTARGLESELVTEELQSPSTEEIMKLAIGTRTGEREDVRAALSAAKAAQASVELAVEKNRPSLELVGSVSLTGKDANNAWQAYKDSFSTEHPVLGLGVKFSTPLDFGLVSRARAGYRREAHASEMGYQRKKYEQEREWKDLEKRMGEAKRRLELALKIETAQEQKWTNEKQRHDFGRTTTYQVLTFEQDFATAQLQRIRLETDVLLTAAQMKLFADSRGNQ